jgi:tRNA 5-methylaminomethyl-2-thiouridine biosynthesis bifunctional protein
VEKFPLARADLQRAIEPFVELGDLLEQLLAVYPPAIRGMHRRQMCDGRVSLNLLFGDAVDCLGQLEQPVDAWYLDGFAPAKNPDMWSESLFAHIARLSRADTTLSTYTAAGVVRRGLEAQGFGMQKQPGFGNKREMLSGRMVQSPEPTPAAPWFRLPRCAPADRRLAVIGAGIAGISTGWRLAQEGWQVTVLDQHGQVADAASGNPRGVMLPRLHLQASVEAEFDNAAFAHSAYRLGELQARHADLDWRASGVIQLPSSPRHSKHLEQGGFDEQLALPLSVEQLQAYCGLPLDSRGLLYPLAGHLSPPRLCRTLIRDAGEQLQVITASEVARIERVGEHWRLLDEYDRCLLDCDVLVIACGHELSRFEHTRELPITPVRGQISYLPATEQSARLNCPLCYEGYLLPACNHHHVIGASFHPGDSSEKVLNGDHQENLHALQAWLPDLFTSLESLEGRAAIRAATPDRLPLLGPVPDMDFYRHSYADLQRGRPAARYPDAGYLPGLYVNVGHGARGLSSAFLCAELLAAQVNNTPAPVYKTVQDALHPARFMIRALKKGKQFPS